MNTALLLLPSWSIQNLPLGLATVAAVFRGCGHRTEVFDCNALCWNQLQRDYGAEWKTGHPLHWDDQSRAPVWEGTETGVSCELIPELQECLDRVAAPILDGQFDLFAFSIFESNRLSTLHLVQRIKKKFPAARMIFGGPSVKDIFLSSESTGPSIGRWLTEKDSAIPGEAETSLPGLLRWWEAGAGEPPEGVITIENSSIRYRPVTPNDIWERMLIGYSDFDLAHYSQQVIPVEITRGCVWKCAFCTEKNLHAGFRMKSIDCLMDTFRTCLENLNTRWFSFVGSNINGDFPYFKNLLVRILSSGLHFGWGGSLLLDKRLDTSTIRKMARSGCTYVNTGLESASPEILRKMNKHIDVDTAERIIGDLSAARINVAVNFIAGFPGETEADHQRSLDFIRRNGNHIKRIHVSPCRIFDGSLLHRCPEDFGIEIPSGGGLDEWVTVDNDITPAIRERRVREIIDTCVDESIQWLAPFEKKPAMRRNF